MVLPHTPTYSILQLKDLLRLDTKKDNVCGFGDSYGLSMFEPYKCTRNNYAHGISWPKPHRFSLAALHPPGSGLELYASLEEVGDPLPKLLPALRPPVIFATEEVMVLDKPSGLRTEDALRA